jgi:hypothetical protein
LIPPVSFGGRPDVMQVVVVGGGMDVNHSPSSK